LWAVVISPSCSIPAAGRLEPGRRLVDPEFRVMDNGGRPGSGLVSCRLGEQLQEAAPAAAGDPSRNAAAEHPEARSRLRERRVGEAGSPLWPLVTLRAVTTAHCGFWQTSGKRRFLTFGACNRPGTRPGLTWWFVVEPPAGIEPATPSLPWNHREPLCGTPFRQVTRDRRAVVIGSPSEKLCALSSPRKRPNARSSSL
jgi:hypothetical protein